MNTNRLTTWFDTTWSAIKHYWPVIVLTAAIVLMLAAVTATATLQSCGCQGPVLTPTVTVTPGPTATHTPTPMWEPPATPTPVPGANDVVTGTHALWWDVMYNVGPGELEWGWDKDCHLVVIDTASGKVYETACGGTTFQYAASYADAVRGHRYQAVCTGGLVYVYVIDVEVRQDGAVVRSKTTTTTLTGMMALAGTPMPSEGQYDGDLPWQISSKGLTGRLEVWNRGDWIPNCDELPTVAMYQARDDELVPWDERGFSLVGVYER